MFTIWFVYKYFFRIVWVSYMKYRLIHHQSVILHIWIQWVLCACVCINMISYSSNNFCITYKTENVYDQRVGWAQVNYYDLGGYRRVYLIFE